MSVTKSTQGTASSQYTASCPGRVSIAPCPTIHTLGVGTTSDSCQDPGPAHTRVLANNGSSAEALCYALTYGSKIEVY